MVCKFSYFASGKMQSWSDVLSISLCIYRQGRAWNEEEEVAMAHGA